MKDLHKMMPRIRKDSKGWVILIDDGYCSYEFKPELNGKLSIRDIAQAILKAEHCTDWSCEIENIVRSLK